MTKPLVVHSLYVREFTAKSIEDNKQGAFEVLEVDGTKSVFPYEDVSHMHQIEGGWRIVVVALSYRVNTFKAKEVKRKGCLVKFKVGGTTHIVNQRLIKKPT